MRDHLTVRLSDDGRATWRLSKVLREGPSAYSALATLSDGTVGCLYERGDRVALLPYERITLASFSFDWLAQ